MAKAGSTVKVKPKASTDAKKPEPKKDKPATRAKPNKNEAVKAGPKKPKRVTGSRPGKGSAAEPDLKMLAGQLAKLEGKLEKVEAELKGQKAENRDMKKKLAAAEKKLDTRIKREEVLMAALKITSRTKKGDPGKVLAELNSGLLKTEEYLLHTGKRIDNILNAVKNHREYLVKLNARVNKIGVKEKIEMELDIMSNTLSIMSLNGFDFDKSLFKDIERARKAMEKKDADIGKLKKRMARLDNKFEEEMERFDFSSVYSKKKDIPGYG